MRQRDFVALVAVIVVVLVIWGIPMGPTNIHQRASLIELILGVPEAATAITPAPKSSTKCNLSRKCPMDRFAFYIMSGAANIVGPKICFNDQIIMSSVLNNVGPGLNIVLVNGKNGKIEKIDYLNMNADKPEDILAYLKVIEPGMIVLVASFDDMIAKMTDEMREIFVGLGSTLIKSAKLRDNWVFAGASGSAEKSPFEKLSVNNPEDNAYGEWPEVVEVGGCFPRKI